MQNRGTGFAFAFAQVGTHPCQHFTHSQTACCWKQKDNCRFPLHTRADFNQSTPVTTPNPVDTSDSFPTGHSPWPRFERSVVMDGEEEDRVLVRFR